MNTFKCRACNMYSFSANPDMKGLKCPYCGGIVFQKEAESDKIRCDHYMVCADRVCVHANHHVAHELCNQSICYKFKNSRCL